MAKYAPVTILNGQVIEGELRDTAEEALNDALDILRQHENVDVSIRRWHEPRAENRGQLGQWVSPSGRPYDLVEMERLSRRRVADR